MTRRLPPGLKKRLQANLENLTPKEAGRLHAIYTAEAISKKLQASDYSPIKELWAAFDNRVARAKGTPDAPRAAAAYHGFVFLSRLLHTVYLVGPSLFTTVALDALQVQSSILFLLQQDVMLTLVRELRTTLFAGPRPISPADFDRAVAWLNGDYLYMLTDTVELMIDKEEEERWERVRFPAVEIPQEFALATLGISEAEYDMLGYATPDFPHGMTDTTIHAVIETARRVQATRQETVRQAWAADQGEQLLQDVFAGDQARLAAWIRGAEPDYQYSENERQARGEAIVADRVAKLHTGELRGGEAIVHDQLGSPVLIENGTIPAWAALRILWRPYVTSRAYRIIDDATTAENVLYGSDEVRHQDGKTLADAELYALVAAFLKDCRRRPWGKKLPAKPDLRALVTFLTQTRHPLLQLNPPDLGRVDFALWAKYDGEGLAWQTGPAATAASLHEVVGDYDWGEDMVRDIFYIHSRPEVTRASMRHALALMNSVDNSRQPFTYRKKQDAEEGLLPLSEMLGFEFMAPLEVVVKRYRQVADGLVSIRAALAAVADRYFDGLPILPKEQTASLEQAAEYLAEGGDLLNHWLDRLSSPPWDIDTTTITPGKPTVDEDMVETLVADWLAITRQTTGIKSEEGLIW